ncbi:vitellogenin-like [Coccinella septempunctata]|uniref:vitellogenin-like n=1 Tax=Coccinella septempunctata TaxID=41139 RepID=UPI001D08D047|nr:vitellogenin-like [Coccinella septempunctata]
MLKKFLLCFLVGLSFARQDSPAWKENTEYTYEVYGRSLSSLKISDKYTGILLKAKFIVQTQDNGNLRCKISNPEYAEIQSHMPEGWMSNISDSKVSYQPLEISQKPFDVILKNGVVKDLVMEHDVEQWEANIIKSFVSQLQLDTRAENVKPCENNILPKEGSNNAVFKTLEDTVTGITETNYDIHPMPEYMLQSKPYLAPYPHLKGDGSIIEIVKNKNFTGGHDLPSYYFRFGKAGHYEPQSNKMGQLVHRNSMGRTVITGTLQRFTIQFSETVNEVILSVKGVERGSVNSMMRIKLVNAEQQNSQFPEISSPVHVGSLVYSYEKQKSGNKVTEGKMYRASEYQSGFESSSESRDQYYSNFHKRHPRSLVRQYDSDNSIESQEQWTEPKSHLSDSPRFPLLPYFVGNKGESIVKSPKIRIVDYVYSISQEIGQDIETPQELPKKQTLSKYAILTAVLRTMNEDELKQAAQRLYTQETQGPKYNAWVVFRDSIAETGTGPAFMVIKYFIESKKIHGNEAAMVIISMAESTRVPSEEYIRAFYELVKNQLEKPNDHSSLNETMLFTFSSLVHKVYVNSEYSHREYPTHSFGRFDTQSGQEFVKNEVVPYFTKSLRDAVKDGDSQKIYAYIHALGEIGHPDIFKSFEPYLEGKTPCSQFQRLLMVLSLYRVSIVEPKLARSVLYRIYQNIGETTEIRVASVYMLMYTSPSAEMLQRIAKYTKIESNHRVCAAVKSAILSAAHLEGDDFASLRSAAESATHFLTEKDFGVQDSQEFSYSQAFHSWESYYKHVLQTVVSEESGIPSSFYYSFSGKGNGLKYNSFSLQSVVSDIRNLFYVLQKQTTWYDQQQSQQKSSQQSESCSWGSYNIARLLNFQTPELEQLEGGLFVHLGELRKHFIFNNRSIERLPQILEEALRTLENGKNIKYTTLINNGDWALAFPTEIGIPFVAAHDLPILINIEGSVKTSSEPKISSGNKLTIPDTVQMEANLKITLSAKERDEFGFFAPFNHRQYSAGYDKNVQVYLPVRAKVTIDVKSKNVEYEVEPLENEEEVKVFHLSSWPHISVFDILDLKSTVRRNTLEQVHRPVQKRFEAVFGDKAVGMAFRVKYENDDSRLNIQSMFKGLYEDRTQHEFLDVEYVPELSKNKKLKGTFTYMRGQQKEYQSIDRKTMLNYLAKLPTDKNARVAELMKYAPFGIKNADVDVFDSKIQFSGNQNVDYVVSWAYARNQENSKSRMLAYVQKQSKISGSKPFQAAACGQYDKARYSGLDMNYVMKTDLTSHAYVDIAFDDKLPSDNQIEFHAQFKRSDARKSYLMEQPSYHKCYNEMQQGNKQLLACANVTQMAGLLDSVDIKVNYHNMHSKDMQNIMSFCQKYFGRVEVEHTRQSKLKQGEFNAKVRFSPDLHYVNATVASKDAQLRLKNTKVHEWAQRVLVLHPVFDAMDRLEGKLYGQKTYKPICTMDKTAAYSFDGSEYPLTLNNFWTVVLQYIPFRSSDDSQTSVEEQLKHELENYVILARQSSKGSNNKDVKIVVSTPATQGRIVEVTLKPASGSYPQVYVDGQQISVRENGDSETYKSQVSILGLPNREIYVKVHNAFYVIYDGTRVKVTSLSMNLRNRIRGLCGTFDGQKSDDFTTPNNCVVRDPQEFIASYTVLKEGEHNSHIMDLKSRSQKNHCSYKRVPIYVNYISQNEEYTSSTSTSCTKFQTRYVVENGQICFTIRPLTVCKPHCRKQGSIYKDIEVHCVQSRNVASLWKTQIDNGASPDFSEKSVTKTVQLEIPQTCQSS